MEDPSIAAEEAFRSRFGRPPAGVWTAPGRVNLIGDHTDYNGGFALPVALECRAAVAAGARADDRIVLHSLARGEVELAPGEALAGWAAYVAGPLRLLDASGVDLVLASDVPEGRGLASSAAVGCAAALAGRDLFGGPSDPAELAALVQRAENEIAGVPSGVLDQLAALACEPGRALFLDCRSLEFEHVELALGELELLVIDTGQARELTGGAYAERRAECERAAGTLGISALRDARSADDLTGVERRRARHVLSENARVHEIVELLRAGRPERIGQVLTASHTSLRDDFEVSTPALDRVVETVLAAGALGARLTGAGFGGCAIALVHQSDERRVRAALETEVSSAIVLEHCSRRSFQGIAAPESPGYG